MGMAQVQGLLDVTVTINAFASQDRYGENVKNAGRVVKARIQQGTVWVKTQTGQSLAGRFKVYLGEPVLVDPRDVITLPKEFGTRNDSGTFVPAQPPILSVQPVFYRGKHDHTVLVLG